MNGFLARSREQISAVGNHVTSLITGRPAKPEPVPEPETIFDIPSQPSRVSRRLTVPKHRQPATAKLMTSNVQTKLAIDEIIQGSGPFDAIDVEEVEHDNHGNSSIAQNTSGNPKTIIPPTTTRTEETIPLARRTRTRSPSPEELWLLGGAEPNPVDAVRVDMPTRTMSFAPRPQQNLRHGFRPINTLDEPWTKRNAPPRNTRAAWQYDRTRGKTTEEPQSSSCSKNTTLPSQPLTPNKSKPSEGPPKKKPRIGTSPIEKGHSQPQTQSISVDLEEELESNPSGSALGNMYGIDDQHLPQRSSSVKHTPLRKLSQVGNGSHHLNGVIRNSSPDELMNDPTDFTKKATAQRKREERALENFSRSPTKSPSHKLESQHRSQSQTSQYLAYAGHKNTRGNAVTPHKSKTAARYRDEGSPDPLFSISAPNARQSNRFSKPPSLPEGVRKYERSFPLKRLAGTGFLDGHLYQIKIDEIGKTFTLDLQHSEIMEDSLTPPQPVSKIISLVMPETEEIDVLVLHFSNDVLPFNQCFLDFGSRRMLTDFCKVVLDIVPSIKISSRSSYWIEKAMSRANNQPRRVSKTLQTQILRHPAASDNDYIDTTHGAHQSHDKAHVRLIDNLDAPLQTPTASTQSPHGGQPRHSHQATRQTGVAKADVPVTSRQTRSTSNIAPRQDHELIASEAIDLTTRRQGEPWKKPLIYPQKGARKETVDWDDLVRLNDTEFLNDSLVGLFLKYLQENSDQEQLKKMHFFNTFFFETLMRPAEGKNVRRQINYNGVINWTKAVNIFHRDSVIVPVNESYHWYVMIICNLRSLRKDGSTLEEDDEIIEVAPPSETDGVVAVENSKMLLQSGVIAGSGSDTTATRDGLKKTPTRKKQRTRKYKLDQPVIITLDSLSTNRSPTATALKEYLVQEGKEKHGYEINKDEIKGMTAKNIPYQNNFSDCGLYVCLYLEQFMKDPKRFVTSILQPDTDLFKWPKRIPSGQLRQRYYEMLQELHAAQIQKRAPELPPVGRILIRDEDFHEMETGRERRRRLFHGRSSDDVKEGLDFVNDHLRGRKAAKSIDRVGFENAYHVQNEMIADGPGEEDDEHDTSTALLARLNEAVVIDDDSQDLHQGKDSTVSRHFTRRKSPERATYVHQDTPQEMAARMKKLRSPQGSPMQPALPLELTISTQTTAEVETPHGREKSIDSMNTDYLTGDASYEHAHPAQSHSFGRADQVMTDAGLEPTDAHESFEGFADEPRARSFDSIVPESVHEDAAKANERLCEDEEMLMK